jgi:hypothetical protein
MQTSLLLLSLALLPTAASRDIQVSVNGELVNFPDTSPVMINSRVMVPMRGVFETFDARMTWNSETQSVEVFMGPDTVKLKIGVYSATVNDEKVGIDSPATIRKGRTMVPLRFLGQALHANVDWIASKSLVEITTTK